VVVGDFAKRIHIYDSTGTHVRTFGRDGDSTGAFRYLAWVGLCPRDTIAAYDPALGRLTLFDTTGRDVRSIRLPEVLETADVAGCLRNGAVAFVQEPRRDPGAELRRFSAAVIVLSPDGTRVDSIGSFPGTDKYVSRRYRGIMPQPFGIATRVAVGPSVLYIGTNDTYTVRAYAPSGALYHAVVAPTLRRPLTEPYIAGFHRRYLVETVNPESRAMYERIITQMPFPKWLLAFDRLVADVDDNLWIADYRDPADRQVRWRVYSSTGAPSARVVTPPDLVVLEIGRDYVLGVERPAVGVERVVLYRLEKLATAPVTARTASVRGAAPAPAAPSRSPLSC
jgi:hypothetical protein